MLPQPDVYCCPKSSEVWAAIARGTRGTVKVAETDAYDPTRPAFIGGLDFGSDRLLKAAMASAQAPYFFVDRAYFNGGRGSGRFRVVMNAYHQIEPVRIDTKKLFGQAFGARFEATGAPIRPAAPAGQNIYVCPSSEKHHHFFGCSNWVDTMTARLRMVTKKRIVIRRKGDGPPFYALMKHGEPHAVVTYASNAAVEAACLGIPVYAPSGAAAPVAFRKLAEVDAPFVAPEADRLLWAQSLAWADFTVEEMASGFMWKVLNARI